MKNVDTNQGIITFSYEIDALFNNCSTKIAYKSRNAVQDEKISDEITMMDDDKAVFIANLPSILVDIYERILKLSSGVEEAYSFTDTKIEFKIKNNDAYNINVLGLVDASLYECIEVGCIKYWYDICGVVAIEQDYNTKYLASLTELSRRMFQLKKKTIKSTLGDIPATE